MERTTLETLEETETALELKAALEESEPRAEEETGAETTTVGWIALLGGAAIGFSSSGIVGQLIGAVLAAAGTYGMWKGIRYEAAARRRGEGHKVASAAWDAHWAEKAVELAAELEAHYGIEGLNPDSVPLDEDESRDTEVTRDGDRIAVRIVQRSRNEPLVVLELARELTPA